MATIIGNLIPADDGLHPLGSESNFNESMYFNFFDRARNTGGFVRMGNRANEGYAEMTVCLYLADGRVLFQYKRPQIQHNDAFAAGGLHFEVLEPTNRVRTTYDGSVVVLTDPLAMTDPSSAFRENPHARISLDLTHEAAGPLYGHKNDAPAADPEKEFARAHYEQHMRVTGTLTISDERGTMSDERSEPAIDSSFIVPRSSFALDGLGLRDHSWGPRYWQAIHSYRWLTCNFGPDFGLMVSVIWGSADAPPRESGVVVRGDTLTNIRAAAIQTDLIPDTPFHRSLSAHLTLETGEELDLEGAVKGFIPLRNRRDGHITHIGEGMTEYRCEGRVGYGLSEYLDQIE